LLALGTGVRRGELLGLKWTDVDFELGRVAIRRSLERTSDGLRLKAPKSNRARVVDLPAIAVDVLRSHRAVQHEERLRCGEAWANNGLVFPSLAGSPWDPSNFSNEFRQLAKLSGIGSIGPHTLRHTAATEMLRHGLSPKVVADRLGHASTRMTLDVYSHVLPGIESDAAVKVDIALRGVLGQQSGQQSELSIAAAVDSTPANTCGVRLFRGGRNRARTCDPLLVREVLYQLSYSPAGREQRNPRLSSCGFCFQ